ncbi:MAG: TonB-dependent receptor [Deltaproteobacteria bacterium]|nr:MAG: TonB-dependent receptor [Deltaproteobacteria bacterium]
MTLTRRLGVLALIAWLPSVALADPKDDARRHFVAGLEAAKAEQFEVALQHFLAAQDAFPHPATLYNIARTYTDLGDYQNALTYYRLFRDLDPSRADEVDPVIDAIQMRLAQRTAPTTVTTGTPAVASGGGGGGNGPTQIVNAGPTMEEIARLQAIAAELEALSGTIEQRSKNPEALAGISGGGSDAEAAAMGGKPVPEKDIPISLPGGGYAEEAYERLVVTASRYGQDPLDSPSTLTVLTAEDIRLSGAVDLGDVLRRVAGVEVMSPRAGQTEISIRGLNQQFSNKILVLVDGRSTYLDFVGTTMWWSLPLTLEEIDRVEIIRGPGSAIYGANAMNGVVNIITKTPGEGKNTVKLEGGLPGYTKAAAMVSGRSGTTAYRFAADYRRTGRYEKEFEEGEFSSLSTWSDDQDTGYSGIRASGRLDQTFLDGDGFASVSGSYNQADFEFINIGVLGPYGMQYRTAHLRGDLSYGPLHGRVFFNKEGSATGPWAEPAYAPYPLNTPWGSTTFDTEVESSGEVDTGPITHRLNAGVSYRRKTISDFSFLGLTPGAADCRLPGDAEECGRYLQDHWAGFIQDEATAGRLKVVASLRYDVHPLLKATETFSPRGTIIYRIADKTSIRVNGGTSFRGPTMTESYVDFRLPTGVDGVYIQDTGSVDLAPERTVTAEIGFHDESTLYHTADVAVYYNRVTNFIFLRSVTPEAAFYVEDEIGYIAGSSGFENTSPVVNVMGLEAEAELFPTDGLDIYANATLTRLVENDGGEKNVDLGTSALKLNSGVMYRTPYDIDLSADVLFASMQRWRQREFDSSGQLFVNEIDLPTRVWLNARVGARPFADGNLELAVAGQNILGFFNPVEEHPLGHKVAGRLHGTLSYSF